jgi:TPP-dependent pyruvate/acetoin dehydrogenase alpha subunit
MISEPDFYRAMLRIRRFEETVLENFSKGMFSGTTHTYLGQEANAVGVLSQINVADIIFSNHRCHGHFLAYGGDMRALFAELMGKPNGVCAGRGGSQHIHWRNFYSNGIQGSITPLAAGTALAEKIKGTNAISIVFIGDGTLGQGVLYETMNLASLWKAPLLFVLENNRIAQTTPVENAVAGDIKDRFLSFEIPTEELDSSDVLEITSAAEIVISQTRSQRKPHALILHTHRFGPHSKGDDTRSQEVITSIQRERDPITIHKAKLSIKTATQVEIEVEQEVAQAFATAQADPSYPGRQT